MDDEMREDLEPRSCTPEEAEVAFNALKRAVNEYYAVVEPDSFVTNWMFLAHKESVHWRSRGVTVLGRVTDEEQTWVTSLGMVEGTRAAILRELL